MHRLSLIAALSLLLAGPVLAQDGERRDPRQDRGETQVRPNLRDAVTAPQVCVRIVNVEQVGDDPRQIV